MRLRIRCGRARWRARDSQEEVRQVAGSREGADCGVPGVGEPRRAWQRELRTRTRKTGPQWGRVFVLSVGREHEYAEQ